VLTELIGPVSDWRMNSGFVIRKGAEGTQAPDAGRDAGQCDSNPGFWQCPAPVGQRQRLSHASRPKSRPKGSA